MGYPNPRAFSRGKRGIAGTLIFAMFIDHPLVGEAGIFSAGGTNKFFADEEEIRPSMRRDADTGKITTSIVAVGSTPEIPLVMGQEGSSVNDQVETLPWYVDQIPPFDITLVGSNEYGASTMMAVLGVELVNEGYGISIDDLVSEQQYTFIAREIVPWTSTARTEGKASDSSSLI